LVDRIDEILEIVARFYLRISNSHH
jgi:hypothetical protein